MWLRTKHFYIPITALRYLSFSRHDRLAYEARKPKENKRNEKRLTSQSPPKKQHSAERQGAEHTQEERFYKKSLQEIIRSAYEKSLHIQRPALHGAKNSSRLCRFFDSLVSESSECKSSQQVQKQQNKKDHSKTEENYFTQRSHNIFQQLAVRLYASGVFFGREGFRGSRRSERITSSRNAATGNKVTPLNFS